MPRRSQSPGDRALALFRGKAVVRLRDFEAHGLPRVLLTRLVRRGVIERRGAGVYALVEGASPPHPACVEVSSRVPRAVIGLLSALVFHEIGTQSPPRTWILIAHKGWRPKFKSPPLELVHCAPRFLEQGVETHVIDGVPVRVTSPARTVADCFKYRTRVGLDVALEALRDGWRDRKFTADELMKHARLCRVERIVRPYFEAILA